MDLLFTWERIIIPPNEDIMAQIITKIPNVSEQLKKQLENSKPSQSNKSSLRRSEVRSKFSKSKIFYEYR